MLFSFLPHFSYLIFRRFVKFIIHFYPVQVVDHTRNGESLVIGLMLRRYGITLPSSLYGIGKHAVFKKKSVFGS